MGLAPTAVIAPGAAPSRQVSAALHPVLRLIAALLGTLAAPVLLLLGTLPDGPAPVGPGPVAAEVAPQQALAAALPDPASTVSSRHRDEPAARRLVAPAAEPEAPTDLLVLVRDPAGRPVPGAEVLLLQEDQEGGWNERASADAGGPEALARFAAEDVAEVDRHLCLLVVPRILHAPTTFVRLEPGRTVGTVLLMVPACRELVVRLRDGLGQPVVPSNASPLITRLFVPDNADDFNAVDETTRVFQSDLHSFGLVATGLPLQLVVGENTGYWQSDWEVEPAWDLLVPPGEGTFEFAVHLAPGLRIERTPRYG
jgi:hypothetical protein